ncbi:RRM domain-containing protein [Haematococcus lacustris]|uniref:RRM domain-containing protein n=1 Tax=Haematococcus lacustris TaxID=44745 RepID=A0A699YJX7_HAELA|nr:RRM domain-containing protein [Haematococcus lacustris]
MLGTPCPWQEPLLGVHLEQQQHSNKQFIQDHCQHCAGQPGRFAATLLQRSGMAVFEDPAARMTALKAAGHAQIIELTSAAQGLPTNNLQATGLRAWVEQHKAARPEPEELQRQLDEWTAAHEAEEERRAKERQAAMGGDGWTVVVRSKVSWAELPRLRSPQPEAEPSAPQCSQRILSGLWLLQGTDSRPPYPVTAYADKGGRVMIRAS